MSKYGPIDDLIVLPEKQVAYVVFKTIQGAKACVEFLDGRWLVHARNDRMGFIQERAGWPTD